MKRIFKYLKLFSIFLIIDIQAGCHKEKYQFNILFNNNSNLNLCIYDSYSFPDTSISKIRHGAYYVGPNSKETLKSKNGWDYDIINYNQGKKLIIFVFNKDTIDKYSFNEIEAGYKITKRYDLSLDYLKSANWTINYP
jgi:hypothetical protein